MLKPSYLEQLPRHLIEIYSEAEMQIIAYMAERIAAQNYFTQSSYWQYQKLIEMGNYHSFIIKALSSRTSLTEKEIDRLMEEAGFKALKFDADIYRQAGLAPPSLASSAALQQVLKAGSDQTKKLFENLTRTTANTASKQFENALDKAWLSVSSGAVDYNTAIESCLKDLTEKGLKVIDYPSKQPGKPGHSDYLDVAVRRAAVTGVNQTAAKLQETLADELDSDLVETTAHSGARPSHAEWQGKVFSRSGENKKYPHFTTATGYGTGEGLCGWNCRHSFYPFFEGMDPVYTQDELDELNAKNIEYDGKKYTEYEISQIQRSYERGIRKSKREIVAAKAADLPEMQKKAEASLAQYQARQAALIKQTGMKRQYERERVISSGNVVKSVDNSAESGIIEFGRSVGAKAYTDKVLLPDGSKGHIQEGSKITKVVAFAGKGTNKPIKVAQFLEKQYGVNASEWKKSRGDGYVDCPDGVTRHAELHWFESGETGRVKMKVKRWFDES